MSGIGFCQKSGNFAGGIVDVTVVESAAGAIADTSGNLALFAQMSTHRTFVGNTQFLIHVDAVIGAGSLARAASDTERAVNLYDSVFLVLVDGAGGADLDAGGVFALLAHRGHEVHLEIGVCAMGADCANFVSSLTERYCVFKLACYLTALAADTAVAVNDKSELFH